MEDLRNYFASYNWLGQLRPFKKTQDLLPNYLCSQVFQGIFLAEPIFIPNVGLRAFPNVVAYNMSKAAVDQLTRTCALEVADRGVRV